MCFGTGYCKWPKRYGTRQRALNWILEIARERMGEKKFVMAIVHAADPDMVGEVLEKARRLFNIHELIVTDLFIPVTAHLEPGKIGIIAYSIDE